MLRHIAAFEWRYQIKSPVFWVGCLLFFLIAFGATTVDQIQIGSLGNVHKNSPFAILQTTEIMNVFAKEDVFGPANTSKSVRDTRFGFGWMSCTTGKSCTENGEFA